MSDELAWKITVSVTSGLAALAVRKLVTKLWERGSGAGPPANPADARVGWGPALAWAAAAGTGAGVARVLGQRTAASVWERAKGAAPPGVRA